MNSYSIPKPLFRTVPVRHESAAPHEAAAAKGLAMFKAVGWAATIVVVCLLAWQITADAPFLPRLVSAVCLGLISGLVGLRIGALGAYAYIQDVQRVNKTLAEQHRELEELNAMLLKQINAEAESPASSERV
jgi:hypothetical protein